MAVFHLKYRPQKFEDLDLKDVSEKLKKILAEKEIPQAFLFSGPKGAGKTSAARILAKAVNCSRKKGVEPCGKCDNCHEVEKSGSMDIIEIDAASNRGIDDARLLKERAALLPSKLKWKVFIIDEVHMLTREAFNALLKLIEEPPKHTIFVLCTTEVKKVPETVLSRLVRVEFSKGKKEELKRSIDKIIKGEGLEVSKEAVELIVDKSDGSFRNLQRVFNEIYLEYGKKIGAEEINNFFQKRGGDYVETEFESDLATRNLTNILKKLELGASNGVDYGEFRTRLIKHFQGGLLGNLGVAGFEAGKLEVDDCRRWLEVLIKVGEYEKEVMIDQLPLELAVVEFLGKEGQPLVKQVKERIEVKKEVVEVTEVVVNRSRRKGAVSMEELEKGWMNVLKVVKPFNHSVEAFLRAARPVGIEGNVVTIEVFYPFHKDRLEEDRNRKTVEKGMAEVFGIELMLKCELGKSKKPVLVVRNETPMEQVVEGGNKDIYEVAKEIFG